MRIWAPLLWYGLICATSCTVVHRDRFVAAVGRTLPAPARTGWATLWDDSWWVFVKGWHATEFAILLVLTMRRIGDLGWSLFLVSLAAIFDEFHQTFVPGRGGFLSDALIDVAGALAAASLLAALSASRSSRTVQVEA